MAANEDILWQLKPHSEGKHLVLREYLKAWLPILGKSQGRILYIDGFAGPGEYVEGEEGSPIIALRAFDEHQHKPLISAETYFIFIEKDKKRAEHLSKLANCYKEKLPANCGISVIVDSFDETMTGVLDALEQQRKQLAPAFVMIDPFGVSIPMNIIARILRNPMSEIYVSFMYESINRFKETPEFKPHLDSLFGTEEWSRGLDIKDFEERKTFFYKLYEQQLRNAGAEYVLHFDLYEGKRLVYAIFFATQHLLGCDRMKQAIWKVVPDGDFSFRPPQKGQLKLDLATPNFELLKELLLKEFTGRGWVDIQEVVDFVKSDRTPYHSGQIKGKALKPMELAGLIKVDESTRNRKRTYPEGTKIRFQRSQ